MVVVISSSVEALVAILVVLFGSIVVKLFRDLIWIPYAHQKAYAGQGIRGRPYRILFGSVPEYTKLLRESHAQPIQNISHDIVPRMMPHFLKWRQIYGSLSHSFSFPLICFSFPFPFNNDFTTYVCASCLEFCKSVNVEINISLQFGNYFYSGETFFYWFGIHSRLYISEPELIKEVLSNKFGHYHKAAPRPLLLSLLGRGLPLIDGLRWVNHRRIVSHVFDVDKLKTMVKKMAACTSSMLDNWQEMVAPVNSHGKEIDVHHEFAALTADIICHTAFGSSYNEGKEVFDLQRELQQMVAKAERSVFIPGSQ